MTTSHDSPCRTPRLTPVLRTLRDSAILFGIALLLWATPARAELDISTGISELSNLERFFFMGFRVAQFAFLFWGGLSFLQGGAAFYRENRDKSDAKDKLKDSVVGLAVGLSAEAIIRVSQSVFAN
ncbi:MAG: hypothetical protein AAFQ77_03110 [Myxococcota bacterium]